jgi:hypothetical protein
MGEAFFGLKSKKEAKYLLIKRQGGASIFTTRSKNQTELDGRGWVKLFLV